MSKFICLRAIFCFLLVAIAAPAFGETRMALVVGNSSYEHAGVLTNPANDAKDMAEALETLGFEVTTGFDLTEAEFIDTLDRYAAAIQDADVALFFYAGHGMQFEQNNYLMPVDAELKSQFSVRRELISLDEILASMSSVPVGLVFLDACRNNPLSEQFNGLLTSSGRSASVGRGLAPVKVSGSDVLIAFAAAPNAIAEDGRGRNSPFTASLLQHLPTPNIEISTLLKRVTLDVRENTAGRQNPEQLTAMATEFYMAGKQAPAVAAQTTPAPKPVVTPTPVIEDEASDELAFSAALKINTTAAWELFLSEYPDSAYAGFAEAALAKPVTSPQLPTTPEPDTPATAAEEPETVTRIANIAEDEPQDPATTEDPDTGSSAEQIATYLEHARTALGKKAYADAANWLELATDLDDDRAAGNLAFLYAEGLGVDRDIPKAVTLYEKAITQGNALAAYNYGWMIDRGNGITSDPEKAADLIADALAGFGQDDLDDRQALLEALSQDASALSRPTRESLQRILRAENYYRGAIDASFGPGTRRALALLVEDGRVETGE